MTRLPAFAAVLILTLLANASQAQTQSIDMARQAATRSLDNASWLEATTLIELTQGSALSSLARSLGSGGFETSTGRPVSFSRWYSTRWTDTNLTWMTQVTPNFGILHGFSTGERGEKYVIAPSLKLGLVMQTQTGRHAFLLLRAVTTFGGGLREKPCSADYGDIGGVQVVNCRLAASLMPPSQTLDYLVREQAPNRHQLNLMFSWQF